MDKYQSEAIFYIPGLFTQKNFNITVKLLSIYKYNNDFFNKNTKIGAVYDSPFGIIWNGGRVSHSFENDKSVDMSTILETINNRYEIPIRFTFSNSLLQEQHLHNELGNIVLDIFSNGKNEIIVGNDTLKKYIEEKYPNKYKFILSTTACLLDINKIEEEAKKYYLSVLDYRLNKNLKTLQLLQDKNKFELLLNEVCPPFCKKRKECYRVVSRINLFGNSVYTTETFNTLNNYVGDYKCPNFIPKTFAAIKKNPQFISNNDINSYLQLGFKHFKIEGREFPLVSLAEMLIYYLIKDEYQLEVLEYLLSD